jgi:adenylate kinase
MKIGIFGLSGVGKSSLTNRIISQNSDYVVTSASKLIKQASHKTLLKNLNSPVVEKNQSVLINEFENLCKINRKKAVIIELHNVIETRDDVIQIEDDVFHNLKLDVAFFITRPAEIILSQRLQDESRIRVNTTTEKINLLQENALKRFTNTFNDIGIPYQILPNGSIDIFFEFVHVLHSNRKLTRHPTQLDRF